MTSSAELKANEMDVWKCPQNPGPFACCQHTGLNPTWAAMMSPIAPEKNGEKKNGAMLPSEGPPTTPTFTIFKQDGEVDAFHIINPHT